MFLIHTLGIFSAIYTLSAILTELIFTSEVERKLPTAVRIGFSYFLSLLYFYGTWACMSVRQAWTLGVLLLIVYVYGKFGSIFKVFDRTQFKQLLKKHLRLLGVFLILANIFFLPLHWNQQYGPFTEGGGDIAVYSDTAKKMSDSHLSSLGFEEGASLKKRFDHIRHMINLTYTDKYKSQPSEFTNPPNADYQVNTLAFNFAIHPVIYAPPSQFHFLSGKTNYPAYFAVLAFLYACLITSVAAFFRSFGWIPTIFAMLVFTGSHSHISSLYNHYLPQAMSVTILGLFLGAVLHVRLFSTTGLKTYIASISTCWLTNYNHFIPILLPLLTVASLYWFYPKSSTTNQNTNRNWLQGFCFFMGWGSLIIFALTAHTTAWGNALDFFNKITASLYATKGSNAYLGNSLSIFSERWWAQTYGFLSIQHFYPFATESKLVQIVTPLGVTAGFMMLATGLVMVISSKLKSTDSKENNKKNWHLIGIYTAFFSTVILYTPVSLLSGYTQAKSAQYLLPCTYFVLLLPVVIFFGSDKNFLTYFRTNKRSGWKFFITSGYMIGLIIFTVALLIPRAVYLKKAGNQEDRVSILNPSYFSEVKRIVSQDDNAFVLFEPRNSSDVYFGNQPFSGYRVVPTRHLFLRKHYKSTEESMGIYAYVLPSEFIEPSDLSHLWSLTSKDKIKWQAERLISRSSPNLYFTGHNYEKNFGLKPRMNKLNPSFDPNDQGMFSYLRSSTALIYLPPGGPYHLEVTVMHRDETNKEKYDLMANKITSSAKSGIFKSIASMKQDGPIVTMEYNFEKSNSSRVSLVCRYDSEYWLSARLNGKDIIAE